MNKLKTQLCQFWESQTAPKREPNWHIKMILTMCLTLLGLGFAAENVYLGLVVILSATVPFTLMVGELVRYFEHQKRLAEGRKPRTRRKA